MDEIVLQPDEVVRGRFGKVFLTIDGTRRHMYNIKDVVISGDTDVMELEALNRVVPMPVAGSVKISVSGTVYEGGDDYSDVTYEYIGTGRAPYFDVQVYNDDPSSKHRGKTVVAKDCVSTKNIFAQLKAGEQALEQDFEAIASGIQKLAG